MVVEEPERANHYQSNHHQSKSPPTHHPTVTSAAASKRVASRSVLHEPPLLPAVHRLLANPFRRCVAVVRQPAVSWRALARVRERTTEAPSRP